MRLWIAVLALTALSGPASAGWREDALAALAGDSDASLEQVVRTAYAGAAAFASAHGNYFARDGVYPPLHDAVATALAAGGYPSVGIVGPADGDASRACRRQPGVELRIGTNIYGDGVSLVAATSFRVFAYHYDPHQAADIVVTPAAACSKGD